MAMRNGVRALTLGAIVAAFIFGISPRVSNAVTASPGLGAAMLRKAEPFVLKGMKYQDKAPVAAARLEPTIDGEKTPEMIPEAVAYRHLIMVLSGYDEAGGIRYDHRGTPSVSMPNRVEARKRSVLNSLGLSSVDRDELLLALRGVNADLESVSSRTAVAERKAGLDDIFQRVQARLTTKLSKSGRQNVEQFVERMKSRIKIYGDVPRQ